MVAHHIDIVGVAGSSPVPPTITERRDGKSSVRTRTNKAKPCHGSSEERAEGEAILSKLIIYRQNA